VTWLAHSGNVVGNLSFADMSHLSVFEVVVVFEQVHFYRAKRAGQRAILPPGEKEMILSFIFLTKSQ
jgi:hypothetical protein